MDLSNQSHRRVVRGQNAHPCWAVLPQPGCMDVAQLQVQIAAKAIRRLFAAYCAELHLPSGTLPPRATSECGGLCTNTLRPSHLTDT